MRKKILLFSALLFTLLFNNKVGASNVANWEFLPLGINYFENSNFEFIQGNELNEGTIRTLNYIRVKEDATYYIYFYCYQEGEFTSAYIVGYDSDKKSIGTLDYEMSGESNDIIFDVPEGCKYVTLELGVEEDYGVGLGLYNVEENYIMSDSPLNVSSLDVSDFAYAGPDIDYSPVLSGYNGYYITNVDNPIPFKNLMAGVKAIDDTDGDITDKIEIVKDDYSQNRFTVGTWEIVLKATDSNNNSSTLKIYVDVIDDVKPVINGSTNFVVETTDNHDIDYFYSFLEIVDNYDGNISNDVKVLTDDYTANRNKEGVYYVECFVEDGSGNRLNFTITITVHYTDVVKPIFTGKFSYEVGKTEIVSIETILSGVSVNDNYDGEIKNIRIESDYYSYAPNRVGNWKIILSAKDKAGNIAEQEILITVYDDIKPTFYLDTYTINIDLRNNTLELNDFVNLISRTNGIEKEINYRVTYDDYTKNKEQVGEYQVILEIDNKPLELKINVIDSLYKTQKKTLYEKILDFFTNIFKRVRSFFKRIF